MIRKFLYLACLLLIMQMAACAAGQDQNQGNAVQQATTTANTRGQEVMVSSHNTTARATVTALPAGTSTAQSTPAPSSQATGPAPSASPSSSTPPQAPATSPAMSAAPTAPPAPAAPTAPPTNSGGGTGNTSAPTGQEDQLSQQLFTLINQERASQNLGPYVVDTTLAGGAQRHNLKMAQCGLSHACPGEAQPCQRVIDEGIQYMTCGENVGYSSPYPDAWGGVQRIEQAMFNEQPPEDGHRRNLLNTSFHRVGIGIYIDTKGLVWVTEDFTN